jgi:uncharacterized protein YggU (UPF0235/DUF167 family)
MSLRISVQLKTPARKKPRQNLSAGISSLGARGTRPQERPPKALADLLAKYFSVAKSSVKLPRGRSSREKLFDVGNVEFRR